MLFLLPGTDGWQIVGLATLESWFLLRLISFVLVSLVNPLREPDAAAFEMC